MPTKLRDALEETMTGWKHAVPAAWRDAVAGVTLDAAGVRDGLMIDPWVPIFPNCGLAEILGAPKRGSRRVYHTFRALQLLSPSQVKVVILGQDPYPDIAKATGASFEQGDLTDWVKDAHRISSSLCNILLCAAAAQTGRDTYRDLKDGLARLVDDVAARRLQPPAPHELFPAYGRQGVLWLNTTLSISLFREGPGKAEVHQKGHAEYWRPLVDSLLGFLVGRPDKRLVVALWGAWAKKFREPLQAKAQVAGSAGRLQFAVAPHPVNATFVTEKNSLVDINARLTGMGETPISWLPS